MDDTTRSLALQRLLADELLASQKLNSDDDDAVVTLEQKKKEKKKNKKTTSKPPSPPTPSTFPVPPLFSNYVRQEEDKKEDGKPKVVEAMTVTASRGRYEKALVSDLEEEQKQFESFDALSLRERIFAALIPNEPLDFEKTANQQEIQRIERLKELGLTSEPEEEVLETQRKQPKAKRRLSTPLQFRMITIKDEDNLQATEQKVALSSGLTKDRISALGKIRAENKALKASQGKLPLGSVSVKGHKILQSIEFKQIRNEREKLRIGKQKKRQNKARYLDLATSEINSWDVVEKLKLEKIQHFIVDEGKGEEPSLARKSVISYRWTICINGNKALLLSSLPKSFLSTQRDESAIQTANRTLQTVQLAMGERETQTKTASALTKKGGLQQEIRDLQERLIQMQLIIDEQHERDLAFTQRLHTIVRKRGLKKGISAWLDSLQWCQLNGFDANTGKFDQSQVTACWAKVNQESKFLRELEKQRKSQGGESTDELVRQIVKQLELPTGSSTPKTIMVTLYSDGTVDLQDNSASPFSLFLSLSLYIYIYISRL